MQRSRENNTVAECQIDRFENDELGTKQHEPCAEKAHELRKAALPSVEIRSDAMFERHRRFEQDLEYQSGEERHRERVDRHACRVLDKQVQHHEVDEDRSEVA